MMRRIFVAANICALGYVTQRLKSTDRSVYVADERKFSEKKSSIIKRYHVYGVGAALVDREINVTDDDLSRMGVKKGTMTLVDQARQKYLLDSLSRHKSDVKRTNGGSTANAIIGIANFGGQTFYSCKVGDDDDGHFYLNGLDEAGVHHHADKRHLKGDTGTCLVMITPDAERTLCTFFGTNATLSKDDLMPEVIAAAEYVYFETYMLMSPGTQATAVRLRQIAEQNGVKTALSFSDAGIVKEFRDNLSVILSKPVDLLFCNRHEAQSWAETENMEIVIESLKKIAHTFVITLGKEGALVYDGTQVHYIAPNKVKATNTNGAGDSFAGAFLFGITQGKDFPTAGKLASLTAAAVVTNQGGRLTMEKQKEILRKWEKASK